MTFVFFQEGNFGISYSLSKIFSYQNDEEGDALSMVLRSGDKKVREEEEGKQVNKTEDYMKQLIDLVGTECVRSDGVDYSNFRKNRDWLRGDGTGKIKVAALFGPNFEPPGRLHRFFRSCQKERIEYVIVGNLSSELTSDDHKQYHPIRYIGNQKGEQFTIPQEDSTESPLVQQKRIFSSNFFYRSGEVGEGIDMHQNCCFYNKYIRFEKDNNLGYQLIHLSPSYSLSKSGENIDRTSNIDKSDFMKGVFTGCKIPPIIENELPNHFFTSDGLVGGKGDLQRMVVYQLFDGTPDSSLMNTSDSNNIILLKSETNFRNHFENVKETHYFSTLVEKEYESYPFSVMLRLLQECAFEEKKRSEEVLKKKLKILIDEEEESSGEEDGREMEEEGKEKTSPVSKKKRFLSSLKKKGAGGKARGQPSSLVTPVSGVGLLSAPTEQWMQGGRRRVDSMEIRDRKKKKGKKKKRYGKKK